MAGAVVVVVMAAGADTAAVMTETEEIGVDAMIADLVAIAVNLQSVFQPKEQRYALLLFLFPHPTSGMGGFAFDLTE